MGVLEYVEVRRGHWLLQHGSVRLQNACHSSPTVDTELLSSADTEHS